MGIQGFRLVRLDQGGDAVIHTIVHVLSLWQLVAVLAVALVMLAAAAFVLSVMTED